MRKIPLSHYLLAGIVLINIILHLPLISYPPRPVFDEVYFATAAASYRAGTPYFDIHPPLGKLIYSIPLFFIERPHYEQYKFVDITWNPKEERIETTTPFTDYKDFPYIPLRIINALFGTLLAVAVYFFIRAFTENNIAPLLGALFVTLDNALLVDSRFILLNTMYLTFGFFALATLFSRKKIRPLLAGILWGCALSVKFVAIAFLGPALIGMFLKRNGVPFITKKQFRTFFITGIITFGICMLVLNNLFIPPQARIDFYKMSMPWIHQKNIFSESGQFSFLNTVSPYLTAPAIETVIMLSGYTMGASLHPIASTWYEWPFMKKIFWLFSDTTNNHLRTIFLSGNPTVWWGATISLFLGTVLLFIKSAKRKANEPNMLLLIGSFIFALLPYTLIERPAFLYHYFPALIFGISFLSLFLDSWIAQKSRNEKVVLFTAIGILVLIGFFGQINSTYGLPVI